MAVRHEPSGNTEHREIAMEQIISSRHPYRADNPLPERLLSEGRDVFVPRWNSGTVTHWEAAEIIAPWSKHQDETLWSVRFADGTETGYFPYSIMCGPCQGRGCSECK
jgi:hypothetical protein